MQSLSRQIKRGRTVIVRDLATGGVRFEKPAGKNRKNRLSEEEHDNYRAGVAFRAAEDQKAALEAQEAQEVKKRRRAK